MNGTGKFPRLHKKFFQDGALGKEWLKKSFIEGFLLLSWKTQENDKFRFLVMGPGK